MHEHECRRGRATRIDTVEHSFHTYNTGVRQSDGGAKTASKEGFYRTGASDDYQSRDLQEEASPNQSQFTSSIVNQTIASVSISGPSPLPEPAPSVDGPSDGGPLPFPSSSPVPVPATQPELVPLPGPSEQELPGPGPASGPIPMEGP